MCGRAYIHTTCVHFDARTNESFYAHTTECLVGTIEKLRGLQSSHSPNFQNIHASVYLHANVCTYIFLYGCLCNFFARADVHA